MLDSDQLMDELNLDDTPENTDLLRNLLAQSEAFIKDSVDPKTDLIKYEQDPMFERAAYTLATQLFYDRTMSSGTSLGLQMMLNHLSGEVGADGFKPSTDAW